MRLNDRVALITGGGGGIGSAIAVALAREGARVVVVGRHKEALEKIAHEIGVSGGLALTRVVDVSQQDQVDRMVKNTVDEFARLDILVNAAAAPIKWRKPFHETVHEDWSEEIAITFIGTLFCCRAVIPQMIKQKSGRIISLTSDSGKTGLANGSLYSACKAAVAGFSKAIALETAKLGITVNCVSPGPIATPRIAKVIAENPEKKKEYMSITPMGRIGEPGEVASLVAYLASDDAAFITGQEYSVDGGRRM
ncbi:MAG: glucose 1-dehydrogenase [Dehalococcoidia bacterium]|nr:glucose 1-dehydrogenase [Dehalococcoidia bacterium]